MINDISYPKGVKTFVYGPGHLLFDIHFSIFFLLAFTKLTKALKTTTGPKREQIKYILLSTLIGVVFNGVTNVIMPSLFHNCSLVWIGPYSTFAVVSIMFYAIVQYRIMEIYIALRNVLVYATEIAVLSIFLFLAFGAFGFRKVLPMVFTSFGIAIGIIPLRTGIRRFIDRIILRGKYDYQQSLAEITNAVPAIIDPDRLLKYVVDNVIKNMHIEKAIVFIRDELKDVYLGKYNVGLNIASGDWTIDGTSSLIKYIKEHKDILLKYELYQTMPSHIAEELWDVVKPLDTELIIPFKKGEDLIGFLCLSHKGGGDIFNHYDIHILQTIANQVVVALENINLYRKIEYSKRMASIGMMASSLAHEIKNPLVPIKTYIQNLPNHLNEADKNNEFIKKITTVVPKEVDKISALLSQMRDFANPPKLNLATTNLHSLIDGRLGFLSNEFSQKEIKITKSYYPHPINIKADPLQLERVFTNIFLNAINAMPNGGTLSITTEIDPNQFVLVKISDTGIGIQKEDLPHIFEPFFSKGEHKGSGLGLAITQQIIKEHGGSIQVESIVGKRTTFYIYWPFEVTKEFS